MKERCRHNRYWIMCGGYLFWCYECGAVRRFRYESNTTMTALDKKWIKPVGKGGMNPALTEKYVEASEKEGQ